MIVPCPPAVFLPVPNAIKVPLDVYVISRKVTLVAVYPEVLEVHVVPSVDVRIVPEYPPTTKTPFP